MAKDTLSGGFETAPIESAQAFRVALDVMARPGKISPISGAVPPAPMSVAAGTLLLTLCDPETPIWLAPSLDTPEIKSWVRFHTGAPLTHEKKEAVFAFGRWDELQSVSDFAIGTAEYPDRSATLVVEVDTLSERGETLTGPGIETKATLSLPAVDAFRNNASLYPLGLDFFFTAESRIAAMPRTTKLEA